MMRQVRNATRMFVNTGAIMEKKKNLYKDMVYNMVVEISLCTVY